ncbi:MAG TPA: hypothetical protein VL982_00185 [Burkholderiales bacterium]|nr:hypothetical protein [Burkholderiales bacterium]
MSKAFSAVILAAGLAGCAGGTPSPLDTRNQTDRTLPPGEGAFGNAFTWELRKKDAPADAAPASAAQAAPASSATGKPSAASAAERQEFEEWRAWQEWKRNNPK